MVVGDDGHKSIPWGDIQRNQNQYIDAEYLPEGVTIQDPSKLIVRDIDCLVTHWQERVDAGMTALAFKCYKSKRSEIVKCTAPDINMEDLLSMDEPNESGRDSKPRNTVFQMLTHMQMAQP